MEYPFSPKGRGTGYCASLDGGMKNSISDENLPNSFSELMNFDPFVGFCNSPSMMADQFLPNNGIPWYPSPNGFNLEEQQNSEHGQLFMAEVGGIGNYNVVGSSPDYGEKTAFQQMETLLGFFDSADDPYTLNPKQIINGSSQQLDTFDNGSCLISKMPSLTLAERMLKALSFFKESAGGGILAQVWVPIKHGDQFILSTSEQPYLLDQMLAGYREVSRAFTFSAEGRSGSFPGLPGRVFMSKVPEWTSNVGYYNKNEYLRMDHAINHEVRGSIAFPISDVHSEHPCCAVLELVTTREKPDFDRELEIVCHALQNVNLTTTMPPRLLPQLFSDNKRAALTEIVDVLRSVCHAHRLPLALTWIPCYYSDGTGSKNTGIHIKEGHSSSSEKAILCIEKSACYIAHRAMEGFVRACIEHHLEEGQGIAGKALQSNHPFFYPDVKAHDIGEYPLVHHARKYNLNAAVAIRLRSTYTGDDDYVLEFFLPVNMKGSSEQQLLLDSLSGTMQKVCRSLRTVSETELSRVEGSQVRFEKKNVASFFPISRRDSQAPLVNGSHDTVHKMFVNESSLINKEIEPSHSQETSGSRKKVEKKRSEKNVSLSVLQQYFSGSLKDAAKSIGVCPTTLKRICRQHGISRWPSRKIKKVNHSLKKIQTVLDAVHGVEGGLKFDPSTGALVAGQGSIIHKIDAGKTLPLPDKSTSKEKDKRILSKGDPRVKKSNVSGSLVAEEMDTSVDGDDDGVVEHNQPTSSGLTDSSNGSQSCKDKKNSEGKSTSIVNTGSRILVKATYGEDTVRFKFDPSGGCSKLHEEVAARFKLNKGSFQLKYLDDEKEWVLLFNDSDLQECLEIMDEIGTCSVKFLVRDMSCILSSSSSSSCYLG